MQYGSTGFSVQSLTEAEINVGGTAFLSGDSEGKSSKLTQSVNRIRFLVFGGLTGPHFLDGCQPGASVSFLKLPTFLVMLPPPSLNQQVGDQDGALR